MKNKAALILVTYNNYDILLETLTSIYLYSNSELYDLFIIDNNSTDETKSLENEILLNTKIIRNSENVYWAGGINIGIDLTEDYKYVFFLNDDIEVYYRWIENHINILNNYPEIGAIGPLNSSPRDWQCYNRVRDNFKLYDRLPYIDNLDNIEQINNSISSNDFITIKGMLAFFCVAFKRDTINRVGYLDERFIMGGDDDAYCRELELNKYNIALLLNTYVKHKAGISIDKLDSDFKKKIHEDNSKLLKKLYPYYYG